LVEAPNMENPKSFDQYKRDLIERAKLKTRSPEEKEIDMKIAREKAKRAMKKLDADQTMGKPNKFFVVKIIRILEKRIQVMRLRKVIQEIIERKEGNSKDGII
jgi:hypothetical protein